MKVSIEALTPSQKTALVPLYQRAKESRHADSKFKDPLAEEMVARIDFDFSEVDADLAGRRATAIRTEVFDRETAAFIKRAQEGTIVNLGAGLDTRFFRVDNGRIRWFDIDLPEMIDLRRRFIPESERLSFMKGSILDFQWLDALPLSSPIFFVAEGVLVYFEETDVRALFRNIADRCDEAEIIFDACSPMLLDLKVPGIDPRLTPFRWGLSSLCELERWDARIKVLSSWHFEDLLGEDLKALATMFGMMLRPEGKIGRILIGGRRS